MIKYPFYRDPIRGKLAGVCAGIASSTGMETWLVRIIAVSIAITNFGLFFILYAAAWLLMDKKSVDNEQDRDSVTLKSKVWQQGETAARAIGDLDRQFDKIEVRLQKIERFVTSKDYELHKAFGEL